MSELRSFPANHRQQTATVRAAWVAGQQWGVIGADQLRDCGVSDRTVRRWRAEGRLHPQGPGVYSLGHASVAIEGRMAAAIIGVGRGAVLSHATAAWWWGLIPREPERIDIGVACRVRPRPGLRIHRVRRLEATRHRRFPITTVARTLLDYASRHAVSDVRQALAEAEYEGLLDLGALSAALGRGRPGSATLRRALARHQPRLARTRSRVERQFLRLCERAALPSPDVNVKIAGMSVDALWREQRLVVEVDTYKTHGSPARMERDRRRELRLRTAGFTVLRYTELQLRRAAGVRGGRPAAQFDCAVGLIRISLTSTWAGCATANSTARATSSAVKAPGAAPVSKNGVSTWPGSISVTRTPVPSSSWRAASPIAVTAHFVAEYRDPGSARRPATEPVRSRWPRASLSAGIVARMVSAAP